MEDQIRILQIVTHMNRGGLETMLMNYYRNIDRDKVQFDFLTHRPEDEAKDYDDEIRSLGGRIYHISKLNPFSFHYKAELRAFFKSHPEYKVIHVHQDCMSGVVLREAKKCNIPVRIAHSHNSSQDKNLKLIIKNIYKHQIPNFSTDLFACGKEAGKWMFGEKTDFKVLANAIDSKEYVYNDTVREKVRYELNIPYSSLVVGNVGRFCVVKNHEYLIRVFSKLLKKHTDSRLILIGNGSTMEHSKQVAKDLNISEKVLFLGLRNDVARLLQAIDFFVMPSLYEGLPVSLIEAQAAGLHCFCSTGVPAEANVTGNCTFLPLGDAGLWAKTILSTDLSRKDTQQQIIDAGYDIHTSAAWLEKFYLDVVKQQQWRSAAKNTTI